MRKRWIVGVGASVLVVAGVAIAALLPQSDPVDLVATVTWVEDGDTACVRLNRPPPRSALQDRCQLPDAPPGVEDWPVRLIGIDATELTPTVECFANEATEALRSLIEGRKVTLELDPGQLVDDTEYRRILAYVWLDGDFINERMVREGYAREAHSFPGIGEVLTVKYRDRLVAAEAEARSEGLGMWSACEQVPQTNAANQAPIARFRICASAGDCTEENETLEIDAGSGLLSFDALADSDPSTDPDGDPLGFEWLINGGLVSTSPDFEFDSGLLTPGEEHHVLLRVGDDKAAVTEVGATILVQARSESPRAVIVDPPGAIAFSSARDGDFEIYVMDPDGGNVRQITYNEGPCEDVCENEDYQPVWSPDGTQIAFVNGEPAFIYVVNADGSGLERLTPGDVSSNPVWSPDGAMIAFSDSRDFFVIRADGTGLVQLPDNGLLWSNLTSWSPDGAQIAYDGWLSGTDSEIYVMNADGTEMTQITNNVAQDFGAVWSPDGMRFAFSSDRDGDFEIFVMNSDGSNPTQLTFNSAWDGTPAWSPDGTRLVFVSNRDGDDELFVMNTDGSSVKQITNNEFIQDLDPSWSRIAELP